MQIPSPLPKSWGQKQGVGIKNRVLSILLVFPAGVLVKDSPANAGDIKEGLIVVVCKPMKNIKLENTEVGHL